MAAVAAKHRLKASTCGAIRRLVIAGLGLSIESDVPLPSVFYPFARPAPVGATALSLSVEMGGEIGNPGRLISREGQLSQWRTDRTASVVLEDFDGARIGCLTSWDGWELARIRIRAGGDSDAVLKTLGEIYFRTALACLGLGLVLHAAGVAWVGRGLAFVGCSGMGKSTQARLWERWRGATILNEDRPAVTRGPAGPELHGTPWSGSSAKRLARSVPLAALVLLEQASANRARLLTSAEAIPRLLPRIFMPYWSAAGMETALSTVEQLVNRIKIVHLECRPDKGAIECLERVLEFD